MARNFESRSAFSRSAVCVFWTLLLETCYSLGIWCRKSGAEIFLPASLHRNHQLSSYLTCLWHLPYHRITVQQPFSSKSMPASWMIIVKSIYLWQRFLREKIITYFSTPHWQVFKVKTSGVHAVFKVLFFYTDTREGFLGMETSAYLLISGRPSWIFVEVSADFSFSRSVSIRRRRRLIQPGRPDSAVNFTQ